MLEVLLKILGGAWSMLDKYECWKSDRASWKVQDVGNIIENHIEIDLENRVKIFRKASECSKKKWHTILGGLKYPEMAE